MATKYLTKDGLTHLWGKLKEKLAPINWGIETIIGTQTATTATWTGVTKQPALYEGMQINYYLPFAGATNVTLTLTLPDGSKTSAVPVFLRDSTTRVSTHYGAKQFVKMTYYNGHWCAETGYDSSNNNQLCHNGAVKAKTAVTQYCIIVSNGDGYMNAASGVTFDIKYQILYASAAIAAGGTATNTYEALANSQVQKTKAGTYAIHKMLYLVGTLSGNKFTINSTVLTTTEPTSEDGLYYIPLGLMYAANTSVYFHPQQEVYAYRNGAFMQVPLDGSDEDDDLFAIEIPRTRQFYTQHYNTSSVLQKTQCDHKYIGTETVRRTDYYYPVSKQNGVDVYIETRELNTGKSIKITTNLSSGSQTIEYT